MNSRPFSLPFLFWLIFNPFFLNSMVAPDDLRKTLLTAIRDTGVDPALLRNQGYKRDINIRESVDLVTYIRNHLRSAVKSEDFCTKTKNLSPDEQLVLYRKITEFDTETFITHHEQACHFKREHSLTAGNHYKKALRETLATAIKRLEAREEGIRKKELARQEAVTSPQDPEPKSAVTGKKNKKENKERKKARDQQKRKKELEEKAALEKILKDAQEERKREIHPYIHSVLAEFNQLAQQVEKCSVLNRPEYGDGNTHCMTIEIPQTTFRYTCLLEGNTPQKNTFTTAKEIFELVDELLKKETVNFATLGSLLRIIRNTYKDYPQEEATRKNAEHIISFLELCLITLYSLPVSDALRGNLLNCNFIPEHRALLQKSCSLLSKAFSTNIRIIPASTSPTPPIPPAYDYESEPYQDTPRAAAANDLETTALAEYHVCRIAGKYGATKLLFYTSRQNIPDSVVSREALAIEMGRFRDVLCLNDLFAQDYRDHLEHLETIITTHQKSGTLYSLRKTLNEVDFSHYQLFQNPHNTTSFMANCYALFALPLNQIIQALDIPLSKNENGPINEDGAQHFITMARSIERCILFDIPIL